MGVLRPAATTPRPIRANGGRREGGSTRAPPRRPGREGGQVARRCRRGRFSRFDSLQSPAVSAARSRRPGPTAAISQSTRHTRAEFRAAYRRARSRRRTSPWMKVGGARAAGAPRRRSRPRDRRAATLRPVPGRGRAISRRSSSHSGEGAGERSRGSSCSAARASGRPPPDGELRDLPESTPETCSKKS